MSVQLFRIDDRLIHGQVAITWATALNSDSILLCDDSVCENEWEKELYLYASPEYLKISILCISETAQLLKEENRDLSKTILLVNSPFVIEALIKKGVTLNKVNVGGIHFREGRENLLPYLYLDEEEKTSFKRCLAQGIRFECLDVPTGNKIDLQKIIS